MTWFGQSKGLKTEKSRINLRSHKKQQSVPCISSTGQQQQPQQQSQQHENAHPLYGLSAATYSVNSIAALPAHPVSDRHMSSSNVCLSHAATYPSTTPSSTLSLSGGGKRIQQRSLAKWQSCTNLSKSMVSQTVGIAHLTMSELENQVRHCVGSGVDVYAVMARKLDQIITSIDDELFTGRERELVVAYDVKEEGEKGKDGEKDEEKTVVRHRATSYFAKVYLYSNSRLPSDLPPLKLYPPAYPLLRLAAQYSRGVYTKPAGLERSHSFVDADWYSGTKAMVIKSVPVDSKNTIVFAIRGTQSFRDWAVNMKTAPTSPANFLDDPTNLCHAGFLSVAKKMVAPVAARLRSLLAENPNRSSYSLLIAGHSAGGAIASLLYCHMLSSSDAVSSELKHLRGLFKAVHCVTFGTPPISLRPLQLPAEKTSMFFSFINEGDPVPRAEKAYVVSLLDLYVSPTCSFSFGVRRQDRNKRSVPRHWQAPEATLSRAGLLILLRGNKSDPNAIMEEGESMEGVEALVTNDSQMRAVVFGDPLMHTMDLYAKRIEELAMMNA